MLRLLILGFTLILAGCNTTSKPQNHYLPIHQGQQQEQQGQGSLQHWIGNELLPYLTKTLAQHPKFIAEPVLLVAMHNEQISSQIDNLTADIRELLMDGLIDYPNIHVVRRQLDHQNRHQRSLTNVSCDIDADVRYFIGLEINRSAVTGAYTFRVRATAADNPDAWVTGFNQTWHGHLTPQQQRAATSTRRDSFLKGLRTMPFQHNESDRLAQYLAHNLSCILAQSGDTQHTIFVDTSAFSGQYAALVNMTANYISRFKEIRLTADPRNANAKLVFDLFTIDPQSNLKMLNVSVAYNNGNKAQGADTQVYLNFSPQMAAATIKRWEFVVPLSQTQCIESDPWHHGEQHTTTLSLGDSGCFALQYHTSGKYQQIIYRTPDGRYALLDAGCVTATVGQSITRLPAKGSSNNAIYLTGLNGSERFYLLSTAQPLRQSPLAEWVATLPPLCQGTSARSGSAIAFEQMLLAYRRNHQDLDWQVLTLDHI